MNLTNHTGIAAALLKNGSPTSDRHMMGCVIARRVYTVSESGGLAEAADAPWPIGPSAEDTALGQMPGDKPFYMGGVDVLLGGKVNAGDLAERIEVELEVGRTFRRRIVVTGDRSWVMGPDGTPLMSPPKPFRTMPLSYELAFGGKAETPAGSAPYPANPDGCGHAFSAKEAIGKRLPNLEHPAHLLERWDDRPRPVGLGYYSAQGALRPLSAIDHPMAASLGTAMFGRGPVKAAPPIDAAPVVTAEQILPTLFNQGHPDMIVEAAKAPRPGDRVRLSHGRLGGKDLAFSMPEAPLHVYVQLHDRGHVLPLHLDQIGLVAGEARVLLSYRVVFEYQIKRGEKRLAALYPGPLPAAVPAHYAQPFRDEWDENWWDRDDA